MVREVDVVVTIGGARSIPTMITLAEALEVPVVPLPFSDGSSADAWDQMKREWREDDGTASDSVSGTLPHQFCDVINRCSTPGISR